MGISDGRSAMRAMTSAPIRNAAPSRIDIGSTIVQAHHADGMGTMATKRSLPLTDTAAADAEAAPSSTSFVRSTLMPRAGCSSSG
jgi:hypothetical protein